MPATTGTSYVSPNRGTRSSATAEPGTGALLALASAGAPVGGAAEEARSATGPAGPHAGGRTTARRPRGPHVLVADPAQAAQPGDQEHDGEDRERGGTASSSTARAHFRRPTLRRLLVTRPLCGAPVRDVLPLVRIPRAPATVLAALLGLLGCLLVPASAATAASAGWADLTFEGSANGWTGTVRQRAAGFPAATLTSDSAGGSAVGRQSGASTFLPASSDVGERYGQSKGRPSLNLRPYTANGSGVPGRVDHHVRLRRPDPVERLDLRPRRRRRRRGDGVGHGPGRDAGGPRGPRLPLGVQLLRHRRLRRERRRPALGPDGGHAHRERAGRSTRTAPRPGSSRRCRCPR